MAASARVILLCAWVRHWPDRNLVPRALVTLVPVPLDKGNEGSGDEIGQTVGWCSSVSLAFIVIQITPEGQQRLNRRRAMHAEAMTFNCHFQDPV